MDWLSCVYLFTIFCTWQTQEITDNPQGLTTAVAPVTIRVLDVNDETPTFNQLVYLGTVLENTQARIPVTLNPEGTQLNVRDYDEVSMWCMYAHINTHTHTHTHRLKWENLCMFLFKYLFCHNKMMQTAPWWFMLDEIHLWLYRVFLCSYTYFIYMYIYKYIYIYI